MRVVLFSRDRELAAVLGRVLRGRWDAAWVELVTGSEEPARELEAAALVFVDLRAHGRDSARLIRQVREVWPGALVALYDRAAGPEWPVIALRSGADDAYELPPEPLLYIARTQALLRRTRGEPHIRVGPLTLLPETAEALVGEHLLPLTLREFRLLQALASRAGRIVPLRELVDAVWDGEEVERATVRKAVQRLRAKLGGEAGVQVVTRPGLGYGLRAVADAPGPAAAP